MGRNDHGGNAQRIVPGLMAISMDEKDSDERRRGLDRAAEVGRGRRANRADLRDRFRSPEDVGLIDRVSRFVEFAVVDDPVQAARDAMAEDARVTASPVNALGFHWHSPYSATTPQDVEDIVFPTLAVGSRDRVIAVVDTGVVAAGQLPAWMSSSIIHGVDDVEELHEEDVSHGTFVASLLRQIAPSHAVSMAKAGVFEASDQHGADHPLPDPTTEIHVAGAIDRLIERHKGACAVAALNLSIGGATEEDFVMVTLQQAIARWRDSFPTTPIFAAAGNTPDPETIYPAGFRYVRGVAAADRSGKQVVWQADDSEVEPDPRDWVDDVGPGSGLIGLGGSGADNTIKWSGSSFASAVATASHVNGGPVEVVDGLAYWPNRAMRYGDVPGLQFA
jgi:hypothetical protein